MRIAGISRTSTVDYPGLLCAVLFTPGCDFDCFYCHNRQLLQSGAPEMDWEADILPFLRKRRGLLDGVVISGGEPTLQPDLIDAVRTIRDLGYLVKLDTNGGHPQTVDTLLGDGLVDYVALDYKAPWARYPEITGTDSAPVQRSLSLLEASDIRWELRVTAAPRLSEEDLMTMAEAVSPAPGYFLQPYRKPEHYRPEHALLVRQPFLGPAQLRVLLPRLRAHQPYCAVRGDKD